MSIAGRVKNKRTSGAKLMFYDLFADGVRVQVMCQAQYHEEGDFAEEHAKNLKRQLLCCPPMPLAIPSSLITLSE